MTTASQEENSKGIALKIGRKALHILRNFRLRRKGNYRGSDVEEDGEAADEGIKAFGDVIKAIDLDALEDIALKCRLQTPVTSTWNLSSRHRAVGLSCTIYRDREPMYGSYNLAFVITFSDGVKWIARVPGHGKRFGEDDIEKMNSEYYTMRHINANTTLPLSEMFYWSTESTPIGVPFALMSFMKGKALHTFWALHGLATEQCL